MKVKDDGLQDLNSWMIQLFVRELVAFGLRPNHLNAGLESSLGELRILPKYRRWWEETLRLASEQAPLLRAMLAEPESSDRAVARWSSERQRFCDDEGNRATIELVEACLGALSAVLTGRTPAVEVIFPDSSMRLVERVYKNNALMDSAYEVLAGSLVQLIEEQWAVTGADPGRKIRLLEIGAGTGGLTSVVLPRLRQFKDRIAEYCFTDVSKSFLMRAEETSTDPVLRTALLDIERPPSEQGIPDAYDYVLAANVLHATRDIRRSLRNAKACLRSGGYLLLNELSTKSLIAHLTFGLLDGWWSHDDTELRLPGSPAVHPDTWREVLEEEGFTDVGFPGQSLHEKGHQVIVARSNGIIRQRTRRKATDDVRKPVEEPALPHADGISSVRDVIVEALADSLKLSASSIENNISFWDYGMDSILAARFIGRIASKLGIKMNTAVVFDHSNVNTLGAYISKAFPASVDPSGGKGLESVGEPQSALSPVRRSEIAVIGMSGQFPVASDIEAFWENLIGQTDGICELPEKYLNQQKYFAAEKVAGKTTCKWGGVLQERDCFDPLFFNLAPREASSMSFHQRLVLQEGWRAIENAGIDPFSLDAEPVGLYIGAEPASYAYCSFTGASDAIIASRLSYFLNLKGPALVINTACSSSAVAIHLACEALRNSEIDLALAGGVSAGIEAGTLIALSEIEMLSRTGRCRTFDASADGTVLAEGLGVVVLKRLADAERDGDPIYGVIVGSGINQDGKSNGITSPSGSAQEELITTVYERFHIDPRQIGYVEAHGTGTRLGDPVEANALVRAFRKYTQDKEFCAVGSAKAHVGHTAAAAGVVGLIKLLLSMKQQQIPGLLHFESLNPLIEFADSPFRINTHPVAWSSTGRPRMAALNSFGHSGTNAHLVIREYPAHDEGSLEESVPVLVPLSARTRESLRNYAARLATFLESAWGSNSNPSLAQIAYTLQVGREAMSERVIFLVNDRRELLSVLQDYASGKVRASLCWEGTAERHLTTRRDLPAFVAPASSAPTPADLKDIAGHWVQGQEIVWDRLYGGPMPKRVHLPGYAFAREVYSPREAEHDDRGAEPLHPLVQTPAPDRARHAYVSSYSGEEFFLADHCFRGRCLMPAVAYLEMARKAAELTPRSRGEEHTVAIRDVVWVRPFVAQGGRKRIEIELHGAKRREMPFSIRELSSDSKQEDEALVKGRIVYEPRKGNPGVPSAEIVRIDECLRTGGKTRFAAHACYAFFQKLGMEYGDRLKAIQELYVDGQEVIARLRLPAAIERTADRYVLHPTLLDSAIQAAVGFMLVRQTGRAWSQQSAALPVALEALEILAPCKRDMWAIVRRSGTVTSGKIDTLNIDLCDSTGRVSSRLRGLTSRNLADGTKRAGLGILLPRWTKAAARHAPATYESHVVFLCEFDEETAARISREAGGIQWINLKASTPALEERYIAYASIVFSKLKEIVRGRPTRKVMVQILVRSGSEAEVFLGLGSLLKTAELECPSITGQCLLAEAQRAESLRALVEDNAFDRPEQQVAYLAGQRSAIDWEVVDTDSSQVAPEAMPWKEGGVYLITGGAGALGCIVAQDIIASVEHATVVLVGRSPSSEALRSKLEVLLVGKGSRIDYRQLDLTRGKDVVDAIESIRNQYGRINGIVHAAGINRDNFILKKTREELEDVLAPKVKGLLNLDVATKSMDMDFLVAFSSVTALTGNPGQVDYACGNAFMDAYLQYRSKLAELNERKGMSLAINWPLWEQGGMQVDAATREMMKRTMGVVSMSSQAGIHALRFGLMTRQRQMLVVQGDVEMFCAALLRDVIRTHGGQTSSPDVAPAAAVVQEGGREVERKAGDYLRDVVASVLELPAHRIDFRAPLERYGIDSIMIMKLTERLEQDFGRLPKTLFFEHQDLQGVASYFVEAHHGKLRELLGLEAAQSLPVAVPASHAAAPFEQAEAEDEDDIAIIGLAGRYPGARNIDELWTVLRDGRDCITPVQHERWATSYPGLSQDLPTTGRWGGFIEGVDRFDARFFGISPREAVLIDPQERLFLQCVYETLEDAGYSRKTLARSPAPGGGKVGVYVGVMYEEYQLYGAQRTLEGRPLALTGSPSSIANRVSYWFDFHGPSMAVDTMCSSSLTAIHMACKSLRDAECDYAIAGGVNLTVHPNKYILLAQGRFLSSSGRCESFGKGGDGYVPGEGVGAVLLKRKRRAVEDGDHIYGIIKGTAVNHGGKSNGYTVPNPVAQADVIRSAFAQAKIVPRSVSYIEAHGTGTSLGDPIEVSALSSVFRQSTPDSQFCSIGSIKSNIGHCESAAGIAAVSKVLLQLRHKKLVPSLHSTPANPNIEFQHTPFKVQQDLEEWQRHRLGTDGNVQVFPRIAGISSFGAGGSNAHVVIAEYEESEAARAAHLPLSRGDCLVPLSARTRSALSQMAKNLLGWLEDAQDAPGSDLPSLAYTLQVGREPMEHRVAFVVSSSDHLHEMLQSFVDGKTDIAGCSLTRDGDDSVTFRRLGEQKEFSEAVQRWIESRNLQLIAEVWTKGVEIDWDRLYAGRKPRKARLPTYPFELREYWFNHDRSVSEPAARMPDSPPVTLQAPVPRNVDTGAGTKSKVSLSDLGVEAESPPAAAPAQMPEQIPRANVAGLPQADSIREVLRQQLSKVLFLDIDDVSVDEKFIDLGLDSITGVEFIKGINQAFGTDVPAARLYDHSTINALAKHMREVIPDTATFETGHAQDPSTPSAADHTGVLDLLEKTLSALFTGDLTLEQAEQQFERI